MTKNTALDTETYPITRQKPIPKNVVMSWCDGEDYDLILRGEKQLELLYSWLIDKERKLIGHFMAFDMTSLMVTYENEDLTEAIFDAYQDRRITDTMIRQQLFDIAVGQTFKDKVKSYSLTSLYKRIFNEKSTNEKLKYKENTWRLRYSELDGIPLNKWPKEPKDYAEGDAIDTYLIWQCQEEQAANYFRDDCFQSYASFVLQLIASKGMISSPRKTILLKRQQERLCEEMIPELQAAGLIEYDSKKEKWVKKNKPTMERIKRACEEKGKEILRTEPSKTYPNGNVATDKAAAYWSEDPLMRTRIDFVNAEKMLSTYVPVLQKGYEFPIHSRFNLAATGRTTSSTPSPSLEGSSMQTWPKKAGIRNCFVPREGYLFLAADLAGAELHTLAQACLYLVGYSKLGDALNEGLDIHLHVAAIVLGISYKDALRRYKKGDKEIDKYRFYAKMANFGFGGGMSGKTWAYNQLKQNGIIIDPRFGIELRANWLKSWPEMRIYFNIIRKILGPRNQATLESFWSKRLRKVTSYNVACNDHFQSSAADGAKLATQNVVRKCYDKSQNSYLQFCYPVNFIHDELILEIPDCDIDDRQIIVDDFTNTMADSFNIVVPDYPTTVDAVLMTEWDKSAQPVFDEKGRLDVYKAN